MSVLATMLALSIYIEGVPECIIPANKVTILVEDRTNEGLNQVRTSYNKAAYLCKKTDNHFGIWSSVSYFIWAGQFDKVTSKESKKIREILYPYDVYFVAPKKRAIGY